MIELHMRWTDKRYLELFDAEKSETRKTRANSIDIGAAELHDGKSAT